MAAGMVLSVAQTLFAAIQCKELRELCSVFGYQSQLVTLQGTIETIQNVLLDAESKHQELTCEGQSWVDKLKYAVYDADDMFDEFATVAKRHKRMPGGKISKKVQTFFSNDNQLLFALNTSRKIKKLREKLDSIAKDRAEFGFSDVHKPVKRREETWSYVYEQSIIGRDADKGAVLGMLLRDSDPSVGQGNVSFVSIVGMGGLGKTALAQLVYNDDRIRSAFELKLWVCVSDEFSIVEILRKILKSASGQDHGDLGIDELQKNVKRHIEGVRYLLILDDLWNEKRGEWLRLREFLDLGARGSRIVVTTRSEKVAGAIGHDPVHKLEGLSDEDSWRLFERIAFNPMSRQLVDDALVDIGKKIVKKCANVPLAIRVTGSMLYDQDKSKWELFQKIDLAKMGKGEESIIPILKFSYCHLSPQLKSCFSYCALFPKDYDISKELLICLWSAQGYLQPLNDMQKIEDVGEEYFSILLQRCFFQDIEENEYGPLLTCKMHDLIHDLAQEVAGKESSYLTEESRRSPLHIHTRHISVDAWRSELLGLCNTLGKMRGLRTFLRPSDRVLNCGSQVATLVKECRRLRVLDLHKLCIKDLPSSMNSLSHLRYLDLSGNEELEVLPKSISRLYNLQVLNLESCYRIKELPEDLRDLANLRHLDLTDCFALTHMPAGIDSLKGLCTLTRFVLGAESSKKGQIGQLRDLMPLINLRGELWIQFRDGYSYDATNVEEGAYLVNKEHVKDLIIEEAGTWDKKEPVIVDERLLERLEPHRDLRRIEIRGYKGIKLPKWAAALVISFPHLVRIRLNRFYGLQHLPPLSQLKHLECLELNDMPDLEFMEDDYGSENVPSFPSLRFLGLFKCPNMKYIPQCPKVKSFDLCNLNEALKFCGQSDDKASARSPATSSSSSCMPSDTTSINENSNNNNSGVDVVFDLQCLLIDNFGLLKSLFGESLRSIHDLRLSNLKVESLLTVAEEYQRYASSILCLSFEQCQNLKNLSGGGLEHLTNLKQLSIVSCHNLELKEGIPWKALHRLHSLSLVILPQLVNLPKGLQCLTSLQGLYIQFCYDLETLPEWLDCLKSLKSLTIRCCPKLNSLPEAILPTLTQLRIQKCDGLKERYSEPNGKDWSKICHIRYLEIIY